MSDKLPRKSDLTEEPILGAESADFAVDSYLEYRFGEWCMEIMESARRYQGTILDYVRDGKSCWRRG